MYSRLEIERQIAEHYKTIGMCENAMISPTMLPVRYRACQNQIKASKNAISQLQAQLMSVTQRKE